MSETNTLRKPRKNGTKGGNTGTRQTLAAAIKGKYSWVPYSSEDFNRDKRREIALEDRA